jgi:hypothetical protein
MIFRQLFDPQSSTYTYLLADEHSRQAVLVDPVFEQARRDTARADGTFRFDSVTSGRYRIAVAAQGGAYVENALYSGADALNVPIQIDRDGDAIHLWIGFAAGRIDAVVEHAGQAFPNARVLLAPATRTRFDLFKTASSDRDGRVSFSNVPPGSYKLFAWESLARINAYRNPRFLEPFESYGRPIAVGKTDTAFEGRIEVLPAVP